MTEFQTIVRIQPVYCGACGMPLEYCEFGRDYETHCIPWIKKHHPDLWISLQPSKGAADTPSMQKRPDRPWTIEERLKAFYEKYEPGKMDNIPGLLVKYAGKEENLFVALVKKYGPEPDDPFYADDDDDEDSDSASEEVNTKAMKEMSISSKKQRGPVAKVATKKDTRVVIQKVSRNRKKATTVVTGMDTIDGIVLKDVTKMFSKRFAGSSSVKDGPQGKEIILQGDHMDAVAEWIVAQFQVDGSSVYLDIDGKFVPYE
jgi:density-regulated protein